MTKNLELEQECIYSTIGVYNLLLKNLEKVFKPYNISASKFNILMVIKHKAPKEGISQIDIGSKLIVGEANIAKITSKLYEQGYITRKTNPNYTDIIDTCTLFKKQGNDPHMIKGNFGNIKITTIEDLYILRALIRYREDMEAFGFRQNTWELCLLLIPVGLGKRWEKYEF